MSAQSIYDFELPQRKGDPVPLKNTMKEKS